MHDYVCTLAIIMSDIAINISICEKLTVGKKFLGINLTQDTGWNHILREISLWQ